MTGRTARLLVAALLALAALAGCAPAPDHRSGAALGADGMVAGAAPRIGGVPAQSGPATTRTTTTIDLGQGLLNFPGPAQQWVAANPDDPRTPLISRRIAAQPSALWLTSNDSFGNLSQAVAMSRAQDRTMVLTLWKIPLRWDGISAPTRETLAQYEAWIDRVVATIGSARAIVVLEPDSLWFYDRLPTDADRTVRLAAMRYAIAKLGSGATRTRVYIDAGTSSGSVTPTRMATLLSLVGVTQTAGFAVDVSSYAPVADITTYAHDIRNALIAKGVADPRYVIDSSRNGGSSWAYDWCNPPSQRLGAAPRIVAGGSGNGRDMDLWIKQPGTSDGDCGPVGGGAGSTGGQFLPAVAYKMITG